MDVKYLVDELRAKGCATHTAHAGMILKCNGVSFSLESLWDLEVIHGFNLVDYISKLCKR